jgi:hypothetical protein
MELPPQLFKPCRIGGRVTHGVLNVPVPHGLLPWVCVRSSFCREFTLDEASESRAKWGTAFSSIYKMNPFVECFRIF